MYFSKLCYRNTFIQTANATNTMLGRETKYSSLAAVEVLVAEPRPSLCDPWSVVHQVPLSAEFPRQEY